MLEQGADLIKDIKNTPKEDRPWAREIIYISVCIAICVATFFIFKAQTSNAEKRAEEAEKEAQQLREMFVNEGKQCPTLVREAEEKRDLYWSAKFEKQEEMYNKKASKLEADFEFLLEKAKRIERKSAELDKRLK